MERRPIITPSRISTMPRPQTEARMHLDRYQMAIEKSRLEKELEMLESRQIQIKERLTQIEQQSDVMAALQQEAIASQCSENPTHKKHPVKTFNSESYQTFALDF
jgi:DUF438 domain-containing protein